LSLDENQEVGMMYVSFGSTINFHVQQVSYIRPSTFVFNGINNDGSQLKLIQYATQLNLLLMAVPRISSEIDEPKKRIGFIE
jgi:hypothetical protein